MKCENTYFPVTSLFSKQLNLSDFGFEKSALKKIKEINKDIKLNKSINIEIIAMDASGFTNDFTDKYYSIIKRKERKSYVKKQYFNRRRPKINYSFRSSKEPKSQHMLLQ